MALALVAAVSSTTVAAAEPAPTTAAIAVRAPERIEIGPFREAAAERPSRSEPRTVTPTPRRKPTAVHRSTARPAVKPPRRALPAPAAGAARTVVTFATAQDGDRYVWGSDGPDAWDCSGLVKAAYARVGVRLPHHSTEMLGYGRKVTRAELRPADIVFTSAGHVQIYVGGGLVVEAANPRAGVRITKMWGFWTARRLL